VSTGPDDASSSAGDVDWADGVNSEDTGRRAVVHVAFDERRILSARDHLDRQRRQRTGVDVLRFDT
jgi:hypothetical protein